MRKVTIKDVAESAGVSKATVSKVLNQRYDVNGETAERVQRAIAALGFVKDRRAVQLAQGRSDSVGLIVPSSTDEWMIEVLRGAMQEAQAARFTIAVQTFPEGVADTDRLVADLRGRAFDGVLVVQPRDHLPWLPDLQAAGIPVTVLDDHGTNPGITAFVPDESTGIEEAVSHLVGLGRESFALLSGPNEERTRYTSEKRLALYRAALLARGFVLDDAHVVPAEYSLAGGEAGVAHLLKRGVRFDALIASSDAMAVGAMRALKAAGLVVPRAVSVVGFDDFPAANYTDPRLTTVHNPLFDMSARAVRGLIASITGKVRQEAAREIVRTHLIVRDSTGPAINQGG
ncbi:LacI family transcriptional regulator [Mesorhizobium sp. BR1-1-16]|uniref:LacI family DNA-binding transcriptional regulator n=1 Tax=Mesorhizobium sp. BR1-1-16 TaxID=2876653 RepID=UPI001CCF4EA1|nr:LacI family DNA-binding transcriptional regulator [Mesorhizobium sp. BR1-1-16]MBZ9936766.1 LacI family transcriptional regulator [Mesorhizobium sp. BR1-1-16]